MSWYRTYRPRKVAELHLSSVRSALQQLLERGWLPHSLLLAGPKGTGKTSTARIVAALVNDPANQAQVAAVFGNRAKGKKTTGVLQEPDDTNDVVARIFTGSSLAVHELDAASHRGIDDIRQLKEQTALPPAEGVVAVYILDEVHMLTTEAFNALLKLLEEPPAQVMFILATTELHKLPATIVSRCTVVQFSTATTTELVSALEPIAKAEHLSYDLAGLELIAQKADGSFRDATKLAEQLASQLGELTAAKIGELWGDQRTPIKALVQAILAKDPPAVVQAISQLRQTQPDYKAALKSLVEYLYQDMMLAMGVVPGPAELPAKISHFLLQAFTALPMTETSPIPLLTLELKALELVFRAQQKEGNSGAAGSMGNGSGVQSTKPTAKPAGKMVASAAGSKAAVAVPEQPEEELGVVLVEPDLVVTDQANQELDLTATAAPEVVPTAGEVPTADPRLLVEKWLAIVEAMKVRNSTLAAILNSARPRISENGAAQVEVFYRFHRDQLMQPKFQAMFQASLQEAIGGKLEVQYVVVPPPLAAEPTSATAPGHAPAADTVPTGTLSDVASQILL